jgi:hypothetical protein
MGNAIDRTLLEYHSFMPVAFKERKHITQWFRNRNIKRYVYNISYSGKCLKIGKSAANAECPKKNPGYGDRLVRICGWLFPDKFFDPLSGSGAEITNQWTAFENQHDIKNREDEKFIITIHDCTNYNKLAGIPENKIPVKQKKISRGVTITVIDYNWVIDKYEAQLISEYKNIHGILPVGNIREETKALNKLYPILSDDLFEIAA